MISLVFGDFKVFFVCVILKIMLQLPYFSMLYTSVLMSCLTFSFFYILDRVYLCSQRHPLTWNNSVSVSRILGLSVGVPCFYVCLQGRDNSYVTIFCSLAIVEPKPRKPGTIVSTVWLSWSACYLGLQTGVQIPSTLVEVRHGSECTNPNARREEVKTGRDLSSQSIYPTCEFQAQKIRQSVIVKTPDANLCLPKHE